MNSEPIFPCKCGHILQDHGSVTEHPGYWDFDYEGNEIWVEGSQDRPVYWACGPYDCEFEQMTNLEFLEWKANEKEIYNNESRT